MKFKLFMTEGFDFSRSVAQHGVSVKVQLWEKICVSVHTSDAVIFKLFPLRSSGFDTDLWIIFRLLNQFLLSSVQQLFSILKQRCLVFVLFVSLLFSSIFALSQPDLPWGSFGAPRQFPLDTQALYFFLWRDYKWSTSLCSWHEGKDENWSAFWKDCLLPILTRRRFIRLRKLIFFLPNGRVASVIIESFWKTRQNQKTRTLVDTGRYLN